MISNIFSGVTRPLSKGGNRLTDTVQLDEARTKNLKQQVFRCLFVEQEQSYRELLNDMGVLIAATSFPNHFDEAFEYAVTVLNKASEELKEGSFALSQFNLQRIDTIRKVFKRCIRSRITFKEEFYVKFIQSVFPSLLQLWTGFGEKLITGDSSTAAFNASLDGILIYSLRMGNPDFILNNNDLLTCVRLLVKKSESAFRTYAAVQKEVHLRGDIREMEVWERLALNLSYELGYLHSFTPYSFIEFMEDYLKFVISLATGAWQNLVVQKACLLMLYKTLSLKIQYDLQTPQIRKLPEALKVKAGQVYQVYGTVLDRPTIAGVLEALMTRIMWLEDDSRGEERIDLIIEDEEPDGLGMAGDELECGVTKIAISLIEQFLTVNPEVSTGLVNDLCRELVSGKLSNSVKVQEATVSVLSVLPLIYVKQDTPKEQRVNVYIVLDWMQSMHGQLVFFSRRFPRLIRDWRDLIPSDHLTKVEPSFDKVLANTVPGSENRRPCLQILESCCYQSYHQSAKC